MKFACYLQKKLKVKSFLITEILTATRIFLKEAQGKYEVKNIWTLHGRVLYKKTEYFLPKVKLLSATETLC